MNRLVSLVLIAGGIALLLAGINATDSLSSDISRLLTGSPTDKAIWMLVGGGVCICVGLTAAASSAKGA